MTCENAPNRLARLAGRLGVGISQLAGKFAYYAGRNGFWAMPRARRASTLALASRRAILAGSMAAVIGLGAMAIRRRKQKNNITAAISPMAVYSPQEFDLEGGQGITEAFGGARLNAKSLELAVGPGGRSQPILKMGGEDDIFLMDGPNGHIYYATPDEGLIQIVAVIPRRGHKAELWGALDEVTPKYVIADLARSDEYETRDPETARRYELALGDDGEV